MMRRRGFLAGCGAASGVAALGALTLATRGKEVRAQAGPRVRVVWEPGAPVRANDLAPQQSYVFLYPYQGTPCFLLDLGRPVPGLPVPLDGGALGYTWSGGVGPGRSVVAFSAICSHLYTHPTAEVAMIHYYAPGSPATVAQRAGVISCCAHGSTFDPARGAVPLQPPAEIPLAAVVLEWEEAADALYATGVAGRPVFAEFFRSFPRSGRGEIGDTTRLWKLERYSRAVLAC